jgi:hypothetical protein
VHGDVVEFSPRWAGRAAVHQLSQLAQLTLEGIRTICGDNPVIISSGYRCRELNEAVAGASYRQHLATMNDSYKLAFEVAKASKHVVLTRGTPAVTRADRVSVKSVGFGQGRWGDMRWDGPPQIFITPTSQDPWGVEGVLTRSLEFLEAQMLALRVP